MAEFRVAVRRPRDTGQNHVQSLHELASENVELAALCDCDEGTLGRSAAAYEKASGRKVGRSNDLRRLLDDRSIDGVTFATPNHWHSLGVIWACQAGKDAYVEKPGSHNVFEGTKTVEAAQVPAGRSARHAMPLQHEHPRRDRDVVKEVRGAE